MNPNAPGSISALALSTLLLAPSTGVAEPAPFDGDPPSETECVAQ